MNGAHRSNDKAEKISIFFGTEDVTISASHSPSLVTLCHQNLPILATSLPPPSGDVIFERPLLDILTQGHPLLINVFSFNFGLGP